MTRRIVALGGHEFNRRPEELAVVRHLLAMTGADDPRVCFIPTAGGDDHSGIADFYLAVDGASFRPSHVSLFRRERERVDLRRHLLSQDLVYVSGGSMMNLLAVWRAHGLPEVLREAWERGVVLAGQSAGAMCWFDFGITMSLGDPRPHPGLGMLPGSLCVHYRRDPARRAAYHRAVEGGVPGGYALDDGAGVLFEGQKLVEAFAGRRGARVIRVERDEEGRALETPLESELLVPPPPREEDAAIAELRELHRMRSVALRG
ncbi:MAG: Type 1 glutamine amidotransferase-like domain-containing protein [Solirubrobacterales bacterium]